MSKPIAPPEAFTRAHAVDDEQPGLPEQVEPLATTEYQEWLRKWNESNALDRERAAVAALDEAGVPYVVPVGPGFGSSFPADRIRWLAAHRRTEEV